MDDIKKMLTDLRTSNIYINLMNYYSSTSIFNIICKDRSETVHSNFIAWLLSPNTSHGLGEYPLRQFFLLLAREKYTDNNVNSFLPSDLEQAFLIGDYNIHETKISREYSTGQVFEEKSKKKKGFIDILIEVDISIGKERKTLPIIIENKVFSKENVYNINNKKYMQTDLYYMWGQRTFSSSSSLNPIYVFLTPDGTKASKETYINITYQDLVDIVLEPCLRNNPSNDGKVFIKNYLRCLSYSDISEDENKKGYVMAITNEEKELLKKFYETHKPLLSAVAQCLQDDEDMSDEDKKALEAFTQVVNRDYTKYNFNRQTKLGKGKLALEIIKKYITDHNNISFNELQSIFPDKYQGSLGVIRQLDLINTKDLSRYYSKPEEIISLADGTKIVVCSQWGVGNINYIIKAAQELGYTIEVA